VKDGLARFSFDFVKGKCESGKGLVFVRTSPVMNALIIFGSPELPFQVKVVGSH